MPHGIIIENQQYVGAIFVKFVENSIIKCVTGSNGSRLFDFDPNILLSIKYTHQMIKHWRDKCIRNYDFVMIKK